jgi:hypothetical protein
MSSNELNLKAQKSTWLSFKPPTGVNDPRLFVDKLRNSLRDKSYILTINYVTSTAQDGDRLRVCVLNNIASTQVRDDLQVALDVSGMRLGDYLGYLKFETVKEGLQTQQ